MNYRVIGIIVFVSLGLLALVLYPDILAKLFTLIFLGIVPGTSIVLPSWVSLSAIVIALGLSVLWLFDTPDYRPQATTQDLSRRATARKTVMKKTATRTRSSGKSTKGMSKTKAYTLS